MNQSSIALLFPGQGSQSVGMGKELAEHYPVARQTFEEADDALGMKLSQLCFEGPEDQLRLTRNTQPAILTASVAAWRVFQDKGVKPGFLAGHSLGEYSAHVAAGTITFGDAVRAVHNRGKYMQDAVPVGHAEDDLPGLPQGDGFQTRLLNHVRDPRSPLGIRGQCLPPV